MPSLQILFSSLRVLLIGLVFFCVTTEAFPQNFGEMIRSSDPLTPEEELKTFTVPDGFEVQLFAAEPDIQKPMNMAFDAKGRMWVSGSNDYPLPNFTESATDRIRVLEDTNGDGRADKFTTFVEGITIPIGLYPYKDGVIAFAIPNITFYRDTTGDGKCDKREVLYGPFDYSRDTHGLNNSFRRGLDGWIYACHGFNNRSEVSGKDGHTVSMQSGNTYRFKIDGSRIEQHTNGQVNPFGMTFDRFGELYSSDCHTVPITLLLRDGYYPSFGRPHDGLGFVPAVMTHLHGSTAIAGLSQYTGGGFPTEYENNLFVGNVMTSRVHRDIIKYTGSTASAVEQPEFMTSTDSWFRPVDTQCGPDRALYVADFYNRVIGHYEVALDHPGRDRFRGRIWRVRYVGNGKKKDEFRPTNLTTLTAKELVSLLADPNLPYAYRVVEQLVERCGKDAVEPLLQSLAHPESDTGHAYALWSLHQLGELDLKLLSQAMLSKDQLVRVHVMRILEQTPHWASGEQALANNGLKDTAPLVRRAAVSALAQNPSFASLNLLLTAWKDAAAQDTQLKHAIKIASKKHLQQPKAYDANVSAKLSTTEKKLIAEVSLAVKSTGAANYLMKVIDEIEFSDTELQLATTMSARYLDVEAIPKLIALVRTRFGDNLDLQIQLIRSIESGVRQQGQSPPSGLIDWGNQLIQQVLKFQDPGLTDWVSLPLHPGKAILWDLEPRNTADGKRGLQFLSSLPAREHAIGILRTKTFKIPSKLSFYVSGHLGPPQEPAIEKNIVSLHLLDGDKEIYTTLAPRNDTAKKVEWDLADYQGQQGYLQVTDGIGVRAYAWIAISGIEPPVAHIPIVGFKISRQRLIAIANLASQLRQQQYQDDFASIALQKTHASAVRLAALRYIVTGNSQPHFTGLLAVFNEAGITGSQRNEIAKVLVQQDEDGFLKLLKTFPTRLQTAIARSMTQTESGAEKIVSLIESGTISPSVLRSAVVSAQVDGLDNKSIKSKYKTILAALPKVNDQITELIERRRKEFKSASASLETGQAIFKKNCATCHSIAGEGKKIGPQLDGIGNRGLDRILEDVLAPNRNIDVAFRSHTYLLEDGKVHSGLFRRKEGELTIIANQKGEEVSFSTDEIEAEKVSALSIMPENWGEVIKEAEFQHLLGYLLNQRQKLSAP